MAWWRTIENVSLVVVSTGIGQIADLMVPLGTGPAWVFLTLGAAIVWVIARSAPEIDTWWERRTGTLAGYTARIVSMMGIEELERCRQAPVKYMAIPSQRMIGSAKIAGSAELYPYMADLCRVLDDQGISHPEIDYHLEIVDTGTWARFLGDLWAVRHDLERARLVYRDGL